MKHISESIFSLRKLALAILSLVLVQSVSFSQEYTFEGKITSYSLNGIDLKEAKNAPVKFVISSDKSNGTLSVKVSSSYVNATIPFDKTQAIVDDQTKDNSEETGVWRVAMSDLTQGTELLFTQFKKASYTSNECRFTLDYLASRKELVHISAELNHGTGVSESTSKGKVQTVIQPEVFAREYLNKTISSYTPSKTVESKPESISYKPSTPSYSYKPVKTHRYRGPFNTPDWERRPVGLSVGYVQKQWSYSARPEFLEKYGDTVENYGIFLEDGKNSFNHGIQAGVRIEPLLDYGFAFDTGVYYEYYYDKSNTLSDSEGNYNMEWNDHCIYFPLHLEYRLNFSKYFQLFVYGGAALDFDISSTIKYVDEASDWVSDPYDLYEDDNDLKRINASWEAGAGIRINGFQIQGQFSRGLIDMASEGAEYKVMQNKPLNISISWMF